MLILKSLPDMLATPRLARVLVLAFIAFCTAGVLLYVYHGTLDTISRDEWRFVALLHHWYDGKFSLRDVWSTNTAGSEHRTPAFKLYFLANALWFGLDVRLGCYLGVLCLGIFALLMYRYFLRVRMDAQSRPVTAFDHYAFLPVVLTMFSYTQVQIYSYDLLAEFTIPGSMLFAALWMQMDLKLRSPQPWWRHLAFASGLMLLLLFFGAGKGPALVLATALLALSLAVQTRGGRHDGLKILSWIAGGILVSEFVYWYGGAGKVSGASLRGLVASTFSDLGGAFSYLLHALSAAFMNTDTLNAMPAEARDSILDQRGAVVLAAAVVTLIMYLWLRMYRRSLVPVALAVFVAAYIGELIVGRFGGGIENGAAPRYVFTDHLLVVAVVFILADVARTLHATGWRWAGVASLLGLCIVMGRIELHTQRTEQDALRFHVRAQQQAIDAVKARLAGQAAAYPRWYCPDDDLCDEEAAFLAEHHLSMFSDTAGSRAEP